MWVIFLEVVKGLALLTIAILCMLTGFVAATKALPTWPSLVNDVTATFIVLYLLPNVIFLAYRQMYSSPRYRNHETAALQWLLMWSAVTVGAMLTILFMSPHVYRSDLLIVVIFSMPLFYYCIESFQLYRPAKVPGSVEVDRQQSFENLIFIPAFLLCIVNFSLGLLLARRIIPLPANASMYLSWEDVPYLLGSVSIVALYYRWHVKAVYIYVACPLGVIIFGLFAFYAFGFSSARYLALAVMITFFLGFGELTKNLYFIEKGDPNYMEDTRGIDFFMQGANWSGVVYPTLFLLLPAIFVEMSFLPIILVVYVFVLFWLAMSAKQKKSMGSLIISFAVGYGTPIAFMLSIAKTTRFFEPPLTDQTPIQTLLALIALIGFMAGLLRLAKDLFGLNLSAFIDNIWNRKLYTNDAACLFLLLIISLVVCIVLTCGWLVLFIFPAVGPSGAGLYAARLGLVGVAVVVLSVLAVIMVVSWPKKLKAIIAATVEINKMSPTSQTLRRMITVPPPAAAIIYGWMKLVRLLLYSGRLGVSWIAGLAAALIVYRSPSFSWPAVFAAFTSLTLVTMSGFVMNDIYDREKDRLAGKLRPITVGQLSIVMAWRAVIVIVSLALGVAYLIFGLGSALWIAAIAVALFVYSPVARRWPMIKGLYTALLAISPFLFAHDAVDFALPAVILVLLFSYIVFREAVLDAVDLKGDVAAGVHTVASLFGAKMILIIGWTGMFATLLISFFVLDSFPSKVAIGIGLSFQTISSLMFIFRLPYSLGITRLTMLSGVLAVSLSG